MTPIQAQHHSMDGRRRVPMGMTSLTVDHETKAAVTNIACSIFTDAVNNGNTLQDALLAVYLSGLDAGRECT